MSMLSYTLLQCSKVYYYHLGQTFCLHVAQKSGLVRISSFAPKLNGNQFWRGEVLTTEMDMLVVVQGHHEHK